MQPHKGNMPQYNQEESKLGRKLNQGQTNTQSAPPGSHPQQERLDTPLITEGGENQKQGHMSPIKVENDPNNVKLLGANPASNNGTQQKNKKVKTYSYFDISPKIAKKNKIYQISNNFPVHRPYSNLSEW